MLGTGILKGLKETARNFVGSYTDKARLVTIQYPEERQPLPEHTIYAILNTGRRAQSL